MLKELMRVAGAITISVSLCAPLAAQSPGGLLHQLDSRLC
jgi:hypothetical protein